MSLITCPYCDKTLDKFPSRKTKCPHCGKIIYVRTNPSDRRKILVTEKGLEKFEKEWKEHRAVEDFKKHLEQSNQKYTVEVERTLLEVKDQLANSSRPIGFKADILWGLSNKLLNEAMKRGDFQEMKMLYFGQAMFLHNEGRLCFEILQEVARCELRELHKSNVKMVKIISGSSSCPECQKLHGDTMTLVEALETMPIPVKECAHKINSEAPSGWCRCLYIPALQ